MIPKKMLVAVDDSIHSKNAVNYAVQKSIKVNQLHYTLFHVEPMISQFIHDEAKKSVEMQLELKTTKKRNHDKALSLLQKHKDDMVRMGIDAERIETVNKSRKLGVAKDIIDYAQERQFDAIVVGRRGLSKLGELVSGSVSSDLVEHSLIVPVWIVDGDVHSDKILIAVDASECAMRAMDHITFMVSHNDKAFLTLYHVKRKGEDYRNFFHCEERSDNLEKFIIENYERSAGNYHQQAVEMLKEAGIKQEQIEVRFTRRPRGNAGKSIIAKVKRDGFGTLVVGRSGERRAFFMGSISRYVINNAKNCTICVVT
jgi:nucleotide-binding universal stress UspA family protein